MIIGFKINPLTKVNEVIVNGILHREVCIRVVTLKGPHICRRLYLGGTGHCIWSFSVIRGLPDYEEKVAYWPKSNF